MKKPVRKLALFVVILFALVVANLNWLQVVRANALRNNPANTRVLLDEYQRQRGSIVVDGKAIATSEKTNDQLKYLRTYPQGGEYAAVTGYYSIVYGATGIEKAENAVLSGTDDRLVGTAIGDLFSGRDPKGGNVVLTLDSAAQDAAYNALVAAKVVGGAVALDPKTGAILAVVSTPSYDPNTLSSHSPSAIRAASQALAAQTPDPRNNQAMTENYPPGSIFKIIDMAAALDKGMKPDDTVPAPDLYKLPGTQTTLSNYNGESCTSSGTDTLLHSFTISCNTTFAKLAVDEIGETSLRAMAKKFGVTGNSFTTPLTVAPSTLGDIIDKAALAQSAIGQRNVRFTAMQAAMLSATVANGGQLMKPYMVKETQAPDLSVLDTTSPEKFGGQAISKSQANDLKDMMVSVVQNGSGKAAKVSGVDVAGKTGTAQVAAGVPDHTWFTGFAPADNPKIAVAVFIKNGGGTGGEKSAPIAAEIMKAYLNAHGGGK